MRKYIKVNGNDRIVDVFFEYQKAKIDGSEIFLEDTDYICHRINDKSISDENGNFIFVWNGTAVVEKTQTEIDDYFNNNLLTDYKIKKRDQLGKNIGDNLLKYIKPGTRSIEDIVTQYNQFVTNSSSWTTKQDVDDAFNTAITWLQS